ncbi:MAG: nucleotidyltransferase domain-containing protein [Blautia sp.]|nr:nucleotidyltransferase domain-containing protein [Blautia sp.]MDY3998156.1 nucleotidyltransferase domain-containing protein [Blautia sp.]
MMSAEEVIGRIAEICRKYSASQVILFGSRAKGTQTERSDIDIAVSGVYDFDLLAEEIESIPTLYTIDLIELENCRNQLLLEDIRQYGRKIYEKV